MKVREFFRKKRILSVFLALALCLSLSPTAALADGSTAMTPEGGSEHVNHCICGGTFNGTVTNSNGTISGGTFTTIVNDDLIKFTDDDVYNAFLENNPTLTITDSGYTVKYKYYRSAKKSSGYKSMLTKTSKTYTNTSGKAGTRYYYKVQIRVYDENGKCVAKTALKPCKYATRIFG